MNLVRRLSWMIPIMLVFVLVPAYYPQISNEVDKLKTGPAQLFPTFARNIKGNAVTKISLIKNRFVRDELIKIDVGVLLQNDVPVYFSPEFRFRIHIKDPQGNRIRVQPIFNMERELLFEKSLREVYVNSAYLLVGCRGYARTFEKRFLEIQDMDAVKEAFERGVLASPADGCIDISKSGSLWISVEVYNNRVVIDEARSPTMTLTGSLNASPQKVEIKY